MKEGKRRDCFCNLSKDGFWMRFWTSHKSAVTRFMESFWRVLTVELFASSFGSAVRYSVHYAPTYAFAPLCPCPLVPVKINFVLPPFPSMAMEVFRCARQECISITGSVCRLVRPSLCLYVTQVLRPRFLAVFGHNKILYWIKWSTNRFWEPPLLLLSFHLSVCPSVYPYVSHDQYTQRHSLDASLPVRACSLLWQYSICFTLSSCYLYYFLSNIAFIVLSVLLWFPLLLLSSSLFLSPTLSLPHTDFPKSQQDFIWWYNLIVTFTVTCFARMSLIHYSSNVNALICSLVTI